MNKKEDMRVIFRVDATHDVALGHLKRCISLANKLLIFNIDLIFVTAEDSYTNEILNSLGFINHFSKAKTNSYQDLKFTTSIAEKFCVNVVIIDSYEIDSAYRKGLMDKGLFVVSISDMVNMDVPAHLIVNGSLNAEKLCSTPDGTEEAFGIKYLILDKNFWGEQLYPISTDQINNILITMGGIDHYDLTTCILKILDSIDGVFSVTAIVGPYYENLSSIKDQVRKMKKPVKLVMSPTSLFKYMQKCSLAFSAGGQTLYELLVLCRPTIGISLWGNQNSNVMELTQKEAIVGIVYEDNPSFEIKLKAKTKSLIDDQDTREKIIKNGKAIVDNHSTERVYNKIFSAFNEWQNTKICKKQDVKKS